VTRARGGAAEQLLSGCPDTDLAAARISAATPGTAPLLDPRIQGGAEPEAGPRNSAAGLAHGAGGGGEPSTAPRAWQARAWEAPVFEPLYDVVLKCTDTVPSRRASAAQALARPAAVASSSSTVVAQGSMRFARVREPMPQTPESSRQ
jgi:hypothetical protein